MQCHLRQLMFESLSRPDAAADDAAGDATRVRVHSALKAALDLDAELFGVLYSDMRFWFPMWQARSMVKIVRKGGLVCTVGDSKVE